jgi:hypothetical protein
VFDRPPCREGSRRDDKPDRLVLARKPFREVKEVVLHAWPIPPMPPAPVRFEHESARHFRKRQDRYILDRAREQL